MDPDRKNDNVCHIIYAQPSLSNLSTTPSFQATRHCLHHSEVKTDISKSKQLQQDLLTWNIERRNGDPHRVQSGTTKKNFNAENLP